MSTNSYLLLRVIKEFHAARERALATVRNASMYGVGTKMGTPVCEGIGTLSEIALAIPIRCGCRFTRLTNAFSEKLENHLAAISLNFMYYNFVKIRDTTKLTPAHCGGSVDRLWDVSDIVALTQVQPDRWRVGR